jgi:hypothetical protein
LKIAIVFVYDSFRYEIWLSGINWDVQAKYWDLLRDKGWDEHYLASNPRKVDYVIAHVLVGNPDWSNLTALTREIEAGTVAFIKDVEAFLAQEGI